MNATIATVGGEFRVRTKGTTCELQSWTTYPDGHAMTGGGVRLDAQTLRLAIHTLRLALHVVERAEAAP